MVNTELHLSQQRRLHELTPTPDKYLQGLQAYVVGGAVRDALLGQPAGDRDWVVVGTTPEELARRGFIPVGGDFPVFLHPETKEEFALARTERKSGRGYRGFTFYTGTDVSLADDLKRRDLSVNAMALGVDGVLVDPLKGLQDLQTQTLRHVGDAFVEDPVRLLRLARFAARFSGFEIAEETWVLAKTLVESGEVDALVPERVWQELHKALGYEAPWRFFEVMAGVGALEKVLPQITLNDEVKAALQQAIHDELGVMGSFAVLLGHTDQAVELSEYIRAPSDYRDVARLTVNSLYHVALASSATATDRLDWLGYCDAFRRPARFAQLLRCIACYRPIDQKQWLQWCHDAKQVDAASIAKAHSGDGAAIKAAVQQARLQVLS